MNLTYNDLKGFQKSAVADLINKIRNYGTDLNDVVRNRRTGAIEPYVCKLHAITGAGKTPILATISKELGDCIILWTTNRSAIIHQTVENLRPGGKYNDLLASSTEILEISSMSPTDWQEVLIRKDGTTILVASVASFNSDNDKLRIHQILQDNESKWTLLANKDRNDYGRQRRLYVLYDESHGFTESQFERLATLNPEAFILASAANFPPDLLRFLPNDNHQTLEQSLEKRVHTIPIKEVADQGLLKSTLYFSECNLSTKESLQLAVDKFDELDRKMKSEPGIDAQPIACYIVNSTQRGIEVWKELISLGISKSSVAVHLANATDLAIEQGLDGLDDTYRRATSPTQLKENGYQHIIWNISLREGWDEPFAYVAYIDEKGKSEIDIIQKIGRFLRQPYATLFSDPDLNAAYFYFRVYDDEFRRIISAIARQLEDLGHDVNVSDAKKINIPSSYQTQPKDKFTAPEINISRGDPRLNDEIVLKYIASLDETSRSAPGRLVEVSIDVKNNFREQEDLRREEIKDRAGSTTVWEMLKSSFNVFDSRIVDSNGGIFTANLPTSPKLQQRVEYGSEAIAYIDRWAEEIKRELQSKIRLDDLGIKRFTVNAFTVFRPNYQGNSSSDAFRYKVRNKYKNGIHSDYNDLNSLEDPVAISLDLLGRPWCRNPSTKDGYCIPIPKYGSGQNFFPDFLLFAGEKVVAIETKGKHLADSAIRNKLFDVSKFGVEIVFILSGKIEFDNGNVMTINDKGYTLIFHNGQELKTMHDTNLDRLMLHLVDLKL